MAPPRIYILDDDLSFGKLLAANIKGAGTYRVEVFDRPQGLLERQSQQPADAVLTDLVMPGLDGLEVTRRLRATEPSLPIFVLTAQTEIASAIEALKAGANEYLTKPVNLDELTTQLKRALADRPLREEAASLEETRRREFSTSAILGEHPKIQELRSFERLVSAIPNPTILLLGESGTGKNLVARAIHYSSQHSQGRFVEINCSALPAQLLEAELFGFQKGAFTDARESKRGLIEVANGGTLFLDEIGDLSPTLQSKLLNFLESRQFRRVGGIEEIEVSLRIIAATNRDLDELVRSGRFRSDLYYRLSVATHTLPSLREIPSDIPALAEHFREVFAREFRKDVSAIAPDALEIITQWHWPGNVRELRNVMERAMIFAEGDRLTAADLPPLHSVEPERPRALDDGVHIPRGLTLPEVEKEYIRQTLGAGGGSVQQAAETLGISRKSLWEKRKKYGLP